MSKKHLSIMKKIKTTILAFFLLPFCLSAQIPNADFELWEPASYIPSEPEEFPRHWMAPPHLGSQYYPIEKVNNPSMGQYAVLVKNTMPSPSSVGGAPGYLETTFAPTSQHFLLSMEVKYDSIVPPGRARIIAGASGFSTTYWIDENITEEMETIQIEVVLPQAYNSLALYIEARGVYDPNYGTPPFNGGYDGYAEIVVDNIVYENVVSSKEPLKEKEVQVFPNPASESAWVKTEAGKIIRAINVVNQKGEAVLRANPSKQEYLLDIKAIPNGTYWIEIALSGKRIIKPFIKN